MIEASFISTEPGSWRQPPDAVLRRDPEVMAGCWSPKSVWPYMHEKAFIRDGTVQVERLAANTGDLTRAVLRYDGIPIASFSTRRFPSGVRMNVPSAKQAKISTPPSGPSPTAPGKLPFKVREFSVGEMDSDAG